MDTLRWILLIIGILVLAGIYVVGKRGEWRKRGRRSSHQYDPRFDSEDAGGAGQADLEDEWVDDVRPVRRKHGDEEGTEPAFIASRDDLPPARQAPSLEVDTPDDDLPHVHGHPGLSVPPRDGEPPQDEWVDDVRPVRSDERAEIAAGEADRQAAVRLSDNEEAETDEDGWVDDVRPIQRKIPAPSERATSDEAGRSIPAGLASEIGASEERQAFEENAPPEDVLIIHVAADPAVGRFTGRQLAEAFAELDLTFGPQGIYHREAGIGAPMFSVVNRIKPGTFDPDRLDELQTPGLTLFLQLPGPDQPMVAFRAMSDCARKLAERLGGHLEDERHEAMTPQMLNRYEKRVRSHASGFYRRLQEAAESEIESPSTRTAEAHEEPVGAESPHAWGNAPQPEYRPQADEDSEPGIAERAGTTARKLLGRYEERMRSLVSGLSRRSEEPPDDDAWDPLMRSEPGEQTETEQRYDEPRQDDPGEMKVRAPAHEPEAAERATMHRKQDRRDESEPGMPEELLIIHIVADPAIGTFGGEHLGEAFRSCDLSFGAMNIYHRESKSGEAMFSVINMVKPGTFDPSNFSELETPGVSLFMQLPGPEQPMVAFRNMSDCARRLAEQLGGRLEDETHSTMTQQTLSHYEERVRSFIQHQARLAGGRRV